MKSQTLLIIFIICFIASAILSFIPAEKACGGTQSTCYAVQQSGYEETIGIKNCYFGLITFGILIILTLAHIKKPVKYKKQIITFALIIGSLFAVYFIYLQLFVIQACCKYCMTIDIGTLLALVIILFWREK